MKRLIFFSIIMMTSLYLSGEIQLKYYIEDQQKSPEVLTIKVTDVSKDFCFFCDTRRITIEAKILEVDRSSSGLVKGDKITVIYDHFIPSGDWAGPRPIPLLQEGMIYPAFLKKNAQNNFYYPAARGYSFKIIKKNLTR